MKRFMILLVFTLFLSSCNNDAELKSEIKSLNTLLENKEGQLRVLNEDLLESNIERQTQAENNKDLLVALKNEESLVSSLESKLIDLNNQLNMENIQKNINLLPSNKNRINYLVTNKSNAIYTLNVLAIDDNYEWTDAFDEINLDGPGSGEILKVQVSGSIYDFQLIELEWDESIEDLKEINVLEEIPEIENTIILVETYLPCGIPNAKIKWKNAAGKEFEFYLGQDGYGFSGTIMWCQ